MPPNFHDFLQSRTRTLARLSHPNVIRLISFGEQGGVEYFVMQYASIGSMRQKYPPGSRIAIHTLANYVNQIADALQFAHSQHITHSYLKPENILLEDGEHILLSDFGPSENLYLSQVMNTQISLSSYFYIAPEQLLGNVQAASDQYALGGILYEWICGHPPFIGSAKEILTQHLEKDPPPLHEMVPGISPLIEEVIMVALAKNPANRFASMSALARRTLSTRSLVAFTTRWSSCFTHGAEVFLRCSHLPTKNLCRAFGLLCLRNSSGTPVPRMKTSGICPSER